MIISGLEEFESKVDKIVAGYDDNSWIGNLYKNLKTTFDGAGNPLKPQEVMKLVIFHRKTFLMLIYVETHYFYS